MYFGGIDFPFGKTGIATSFSRIVCSTMQEEFCHVWYRRAGSLNCRRLCPCGSAAFAAAPLMPWDAVALSTELFKFTQGMREVTVVSDGLFHHPGLCRGPEAAPNNSRKSPSAWLARRQREAADERPGHQDRQRSSSIMAPANSADRR